MSNHKAGEHAAGTASRTHGPHELTPEHMEKTNGQLPTHVPPPDAEMHRAKKTPKKP
jgi:hypothetical protein